MRSRCLRDRTIGTIEERRLPLFILAIFLSLFTGLAFAQDANKSAPGPFTIAEAANFSAFEKRLQELGASGYQIVDSCSPAFTDCVLLAVPRAGLETLLERRGMEAHEYKIVIQYSGHSWEKKINQAAAEGYRFNGRSAYVVRYWNFIGALVSGVVRAREDQKAGIYDGGHGYHGELCPLAILEKQPGASPKYLVLDETRGSRLMKALRNTVQNWRVLWMVSYEDGDTNLVVLESTDTPDAERRIIPAESRPTLEQQVTEMQGRDSASPPCSKPVRIPGSRISKNQRAHTRTSFSGGIRKAVLRGVYPTPSVPGSIV